MQRIVVLRTVMAAFMYSFRITAVQHRITVPLDVSSLASALRWLGSHWRRHSSCRPAVGNCAVGDRILPADSIRAARQRNDAGEFNT